MNEPTTPADNQKAPTAVDSGVVLGEWMPIVTAPKTDRILLCLERQDWAIGSWNKDAFDGPRWEDDGINPVAFLIQPTHWMKLPELPPRFENVSCSQCGMDFGPGDHGYSECVSHSPNRSEEHTSELQS